VAAAEGGDTGDVREERRRPPVGERDAGAGADAGRGGDRGGVGGGGERQGGGGGAGGVGDGPVSVRRADQRNRGGGGGNVPAGSARTGLRDHDPQEPGQDVRAGDRRPRRRCLCARTDVRGAEPMPDAGGADAATP